MAKNAFTKQTLPISFTQPEKTFPKKGFKKKLYGKKAKSWKNTIWQKIKILSESKSTMAKKYGKKTHFQNKLFPRHPRSRKKHFPRKSFPKKYTAKKIFCETNSSTAKKNIQKKIFQNELFRGPKKNFRNKIFHVVHSGEKKRNVFCWSSGQSMHYKMDAVNLKWSCQVLIVHSTRVLCYHWFCYGEQIYV